MPTGFTHWYFFGIFSLNFWLTATITGATFADRSGICHAEGHHRLGAAHARAEHGHGAVVECGTGFGAERTVPPPG